MARGKEAPRAHQSSESGSKWPRYDAALRQRGSITLWVSEEAIDAWSAPKEARRGRPREYSELAIETGLTVRAIYHLALRQTEGFLGSIAKLMGLTISIPDHTTLSRRAKALNISVSQWQSTGPIDIAVDSTGLKIYVGRHRRFARRRMKRSRQWRKLHLAVDIDSGEIVASDLTNKRKSDASAVPELLEQFEGPIGSLMADGAYDRESVYKALKRRQSEPSIQVVIPPRKDARQSKHAASSPTQRDVHIATIRKDGKGAWNEGSGYTRRSRVENAMGRFKTIIGRSLRGRSMETQRTEVRLGSKILNVMNRLAKKEPLPV